MRVSRWIALGLVAVAVTVAATTFVAGQGSTPSVVAISSGPGGMVAGVKAASTAAAAADPSLVIALSPNSPLPTGTNNIGTVSPATTDPCQSSAVAKTSAVINITASAQLVALSGTTTIYVCGVALTAAGTSPTVQFEYGTGTVCATGLTTLTGTFAPTAGSYLSYGASTGTVFKSAAGNALCAAVGGTTPSIQGVVTYVRQ